MTLVLIFFLHILGYIVIGRLTINGEDNETLHNATLRLPGIDKNVIYGLDPSTMYIVSVSLFDSNSNLLDYPDGEPLEINFPIKVNVMTTYEDLRPLQSE